MVERIASATLSGGVVGEKVSRRKRHAERRRGVENGLLLVGRDEPGALPMAERCGSEIQVPGERSLAAEPAQDLGGDVRAVHSADSVYRISKRSNKKFDMADTPDPRAQSGMTFAERLRLARERQGIGQAELGRRIGAASSSVNQYEKGRHSPPLETIEKLAAEIKVSPEWLAFGREPGTSPSDADSATPAGEFPPLNREAMFRCIVLVEQRLGRDYLKMAPAAKARTILAVYDLAQTLGDLTKIDAAVDHLLGLAKK